MSKIYKVFLVLYVLVVFLGPSFVMAQLNVPTPPVGGNAVTLNEVENLIRGLARFLIVISLVVAVVFIIWGGVLWMSARGNEDQTKNAKKTITNGVIGALVVLAVGVILQTLAGLVTRSFFGSYTN
jgi:amino acid transporter